MKINKIPTNQNLVLNSNKIPLNPNKKYKVNTPIICKKDELHSSYFLVVINDNSDKEITRYICWIKNSGSSLKDHTIIFSTPSNAKYAVLGYRVNSETTEKSYHEIGVTDLDSLKLEEVDSSLMDSFDSQNQFKDPILKPLSPNQENSLERKIVWIFCTPRSGSSWLALKLLFHNDNIQWDEPLLGVHFYLNPKQLNRSEYIFSNSYKKDWLPALRKFILSCIYSRTHSFQKNIIIKEPNGSASADILRECFPFSKFIYLLRDGRDVIDSHIDAHRPNSWNPDYSLIPLTTQKIKNEQIAIHTQMWKNINEVIEKAYNAHNPQLRLKVKYENLRINTLEECKKIYKFLEIDIQDKDLEKIIDKFSYEKIPDHLKGPGKTIRTATVGGWKKNFNDEELNLMHSIMGKTLTKFGYEI